MGIRPRICRASYHGMIELAVVKKSGICPNQWKKLSHYLCRSNTPEYLSLHAACHRLITQGPIPVIFALWLVWLLVWTMLAARSMVSRHLFPGDIFYSQMAI